MKASRHRLTAIALLSIAVFVTSGCADLTKVRALDGPENSHWQGRLALQVSPEGRPSQSESGAPTDGQSFSASFSLSGSPQTGSLLLFSPFGTTIAELSWTAQTAALRANGETQTFSTLAELLKRSTGTEIPIAGLFAWLAGDNPSTPGWYADLSKHSLGRIVSRRTDPLPTVELRLIFEK